MFRLSLRRLQLQLTQRRLTQPALDTSKATHREERWNDLTRLHVTALPVSRQKEGEDSLTPPTEEHDNDEDAPVAMGCIVSKLSPEEVLSLLAEEEEANERQGSGSSRFMDMYKPDRYYRVQFKHADPHVNACSADNVFLESYTESDSPKEAGTEIESALAGDRLVRSRRRHVREVYQNLKTLHDNNYIRLHLRQHLTLPVGTHVNLFYGDDAENFTMSGIIVRVNDNATYTLLMENDNIELSIPPEKIGEYYLQPTKQLRNPKYLALLDWIGSSVSDARDREAMALILYRRGWRLDRLYLLEKSDIHLLPFTTKAEREHVLEKAQWEKDYYGVVRLLFNERVKDRDLRYAISKYKGTISCITGMIVVGYVFFANLRAYHSQQRHYQLSLAVNAIVNAKSSQSDRQEEDADLLDIPREREESKVCDILTGMNLAHPRIIAFTGFDGCGKTFLVRSVVRQLELPAIFVDVRGKEDTMRCVVKALGVNNIEVCGDLLDFVAEAMHEARKIKGNHVPILSIKLRQGCDLERVYQESVPLASDRHVCHVLFEVPLTFLTTKNLALPRLDFYMVPNFNRPQAFAYTHHNIDPLDLNTFVDLVGTNSNDLDDFYAAVRQRGVPAVDYTNRIIIKAMRRVHAAAAEDPSVRPALRELALLPFETGLRNDTVEDFNALRSPAVKDMVVYDPIRDRYLFTDKAFHTAVRCSQFKKKVTAVEKSQATRLLEGG
ncbi:tuzin-like protein [Angomonas deanei]|uniref:Uncharacterized protein n=1 Tax=Angomonas deanei TaxID=59799 RepID=A0A7G2CA15_9TRYP|nr:tuzin-like protein [Angomonas deanei]CAD2215707.1 hypothetical protein, conserved [Angomonas deanei]|eukprot:EPY33485.1 tuzin-like protein [Angomonas deanei]